MLLKCLLITIQYTPRSLSIKAHRFWLSPIFFFFCQGRGKRDGRLLANQFFFFFFSTLYFPLGLQLPFELQLGQPWKGSAPEVLILHPDIHRIYIVNNWILPYSCYRHLHHENAKHIGIYAAHNILDSICLAYSYIYISIRWSYIIQGETAPPLTYLSWTVHGIDRCVLGSLSSFIIRSLTPCWWYSFFIYLFNCLVVCALRFSTYMGDISKRTAYSAVWLRCSLVYVCCVFVCLFVVFLFVSFPHFRLYTSSSIRFPFLFPAGREVSKPPRLAEHPIGDTIKSSQHYNITSQEYCCAPSACSSIRRRLESHRIVVVEISVDIFLSTTASWE